jgi:hypothetical protein
MKDTGIESIKSLGLQVSTVGQLVKLSKGQTGLLSLMRTCVKENRTLSWDELVECYYKNVRQELEDHRWIDIGSVRSRQYFTFDILDCYKNQDWHWTYRVRALVKHWFVNTLGILVIKNKLVVIPTIGID